MTTAQDLFNNGSHAFADEDYEEALRLYTLAIEADATNAEFFLKRSTTFQKLGKDQEAYDDAVKALALTQKEQSANSSLEAKAQLRKGSAAYQLKDYRTAKAALDACHGLNPNLPTLATWIKKNDEEYSKLPVEPVQPAAPAPTPAPAPAASAPAPAPVTPAIHRVRHEWYQNDEYVTISVFIKSVKKDAVDINFTDNA
ncbi:Protein SGT1 A, partial [Lunasporangiospora selenospora]